MADAEDVERLDDALVEIEASLASTEQVTRTFKAEIDDVSKTMTSASQQAGGLSRSVGTSLRSAFGDLILDGDNLSSTLKGLESSLASKAFNSSVTPVTSAIGGLVETGFSSLVGGVLPFARGGAISQGRVRAFANGGVVDGPTLFPMRSGTGLMGEAGPEAIMPLARGPDGRLGVRAGGGGGAAISVNMQVSTPDAEGFRRSRSQIAAQLSRAIERGQRNL